LMYGLSDGTLVYFAEHSVPWGGASQTADIMRALDKKTHSLLLPPADRPRFIFTLHPFIYLPLFLRLAAFLVW